MFDSEPNDFNFEVNPSQILSEIENLESLHTYIFNNEPEELWKDIEFLEITKESILKETLQADLKNSDENDIMHQSAKSSEDSHEQTLASSESTKPSNVEYSQQLNDIFSSKRNKWNSLASRRDVINKTILRGFKKFFVSLLNNKPKKSSSSVKGLKYNAKANLICHARTLGLLNLMPKETKINIFEELICWLSFPKITSKVQNLFNTENHAINILNDILSNYSHRKLISVFENKEIMSLFGYFIINGKEKFMDGVVSNNSIHQSSAQIDHE